LYLHALRPRIAGHTLERIRLASPFLVRSVHPPIDHANGKRVVALRRLGKRLVWQLEDDLFLIIHLMIAGRFKWAADARAAEGADTRAAEGAERIYPKIPGKVGLAAFDFDNGTLILTEAGSQRRASLYLVRGEGELETHDPGGLEVLTSTAEQFGAALTRENHTLKRALTDPHLLSGIGNAYSDEILHAAKMSPMLLTSKLTPEQIESLHAHAIGVLTKWRDELIAETGEKFPEKVTAFRDGMAAHGRYGKPCPVCGTAIQRIQYATNEANYCPTCQTGGKLLADRGLSRLLKDDWPKTLEELERRKDDRRRS
jgi:formamidopyrimidine-DNA glycosylase